MSSKSIIHRSNSKYLINEAIKLNDFIKPTKKTSKGRKLLFGFEEQL